LNTALNFTLFEIQKKIPDCTEKPHQSNINDILHNQTKFADGNFSWSELIVYTIHSDTKIYNRKQRFIIIKYIRNLELAVYTKVNSEQTVICRKKLFVYLLDHKGIQ